MSLFDVALHFHIYNASQAGPDYDLRTILDGTLVRERPENAVTLPDSQAVAVEEPLLNVKSLTRFKAGTMLKLPPRWPVNASAVPTDEFAVPYHLPQGSVRCPLIAALTTSPQFQV